VVEALVRFDERRSRPYSIDRAGGDEVRAGLLRIRKREAAADRAPRAPAFGTIGCEPIG